MINLQCLLGDQSYGIQFYQRLKKPSQNFSVLKLKSKKKIFLMARSRIFSRSKELTRNNPKIMYAFILSLNVLGDKV